MVNKTNPFGERRYNSYADYFRRTFGGRMQKLSIDAGFSCPNRDPNDRTKGGCFFCNNKAFNPSYCSPKKSIGLQLDEGILFHARRYRNVGRYLAYFQAYSNTYAPVETLRRRYSEALAHPMVDGLVIGTRPDCVDEEKLDLIAELARDHYVAVEYGIESCSDVTLRDYGRGHTFADTRHAIAITVERGIPCGGHLILGLTPDWRIQLREASLVSTLPINSLKLHQLQVIKGTRLAHDVAMGKRLIPYTLDEYIKLVCDFLERLRPDIMMERFAGEVPPRYQAVPEFSWRRPNGRLVRNEEIAPLVVAELTRRNTWQGMRFHPNKQTPTPPSL